MGDSQPWRNPRPAPQLSEMQGRFEPPTSFKTIIAWFPAICWAVIIFSLSTDAFSATHTGRFIKPILLWLIPAMTERQFRTIHFFIRKAAHFTEYFVFCMLLYRGIRGAQRGWRWSWAMYAFLVAAGYAALDEIHQAFVASRTASPYDSLLDSAGAFCALFTLWVWYRRREMRSQINSD